MKTFEDMKHNIPKDATHYADETESDYFAWVKFVDGDMYMTMPDSKLYNEWSRMDINYVKPIPQLSTETSEGAKWVNGDKCSYKDDNDSHTFIAATLNGKCCIRYDTANNFFEVNLSEISKPETPQQREERERLKNGKAFYEKMSKIEVSVMNPEDHGEPNSWSEIRDDWKEVYMLQAESLNYRKGR